MGSFISWFERSYRGVIVVLVAIMATALVILAMHHVNSSKPVAGAEARPIPTFNRPEDPLVTVLGDSYSGGSAENSGPATLWSALMRKDIGVRIQNLAVGGSGYVTPGQDGKPFSAQTSRISREAQVVVVYGSRNDAFTTKSVDEQQAAADLYRAVKDHAPNATLVVVGPSFVEDPTPSGGASNAAAIRAAALAAGAQYTDALDWFHNAPADYIGADGIHPTDAGHKYLAKKITPLVEDALK